MKQSLSFEKTSRISRHFRWIAVLALLMIPACSDDSGSSSDPSLCGNGVLDDGEICDAEKLIFGASCPDGTHLPQGASLSCNEDCSLNTDACVLDESPKTCGNGVLDKDEICDGEILGNKAVCPDGTHLPADASLSCKADCSLNTEACVPDESPKTCGNDALDEGEICDGDKMSDKAICPENMQLPSDAALSCNADCTLNTDACVPAESSEPCGNGSLDEGEICDGELIHETASCPEGMHLPEGKAFACNADCTLDTSSCEADASATIPQGRVKADDANPDLEEILLHRTPQDKFPNEDLYADRANEPSQITGRVPKGEVVDIKGTVGDILLVQYHESEGYIRSANIERINDLEVPALDYTSLPSNNYYQMDTRWKDAKISTYTIEKMGGVPVSVADAISAIKKDDAITPDKVAAKMSPTFGTSTDHVCKFIRKEYRLECDYVDNTNGMNCVKNKKNDASVRSKTKKKFQEAFKNGWYIIAEEGDDGSAYWEADRNVMVYGYDSKNDRIYFDDPRNRHYMDDNGLESFLDCNHTLSIVKNKCIPYACADLTECGKVDDGCGGTMDCPCKPMGTALKDIEYRRSPQDKFPKPTYTTNYIDDLLSTTHQSELPYGASEPRQIEGTLKKGTKFEIIGKVKKSSMTPEWYQIRYNDKNYFVLASDVQTNGAKVNNLSGFLGATNNYAQGYKDWGNTGYSGRTMGGHGCGPTSMANILSTILSDDKITPRTIAEQFNNVGAANNKDGGTMADNTMCNISTIKTNNIECKFSAHDWTVNRNTLKNDMIKKLEGGYYLIVYHERRSQIAGTGYWTDNGHYITVYGYDGTNFYADDPMGRKYHQEANAFMLSVRGFGYLKKK